MEVEFEYGMRLIHCASSYGHIRMVKLLIKIGVDMNSKDMDGDTPLFYAKRDGHVKLGKYLRKIGVEA